MRRRLRFNVPWAARCAAAVAVGAAVAGGAQAFFFKGWPGDGIPREPTLLPPDRTIDKPPGGIDEEPPRWTEPPPGENPPKGNPPGVPEPATAALAAAGLGALALARRRARR